MWFFEAVIWSHDQGLQIEIVGDLPGVHNLYLVFAESYTKNFFAIWSFLWLCKFIVNAF